MRAPWITRSGATSDSSARIPPSPSLSARRTRTTYLSDHRHQRPEDQRHDAEDVARGRCALADGAERDGEGVERARADIAEHDAERGERKEPDVALMDMSPLLRVVLAGRRVRRVIGRGSIHAASPPARLAAGRCRKARVARKILGSLRD
jgi:hypothetical protein